MENKVTFSTGDLESLRLSKEFPTLGLIQGVESFASFKKLVSFNFLHLSVQELLASFYISKLPQSEQVVVFKTLFGQPRFAAVFRFYAAFTKLETEGIREVIGNIVKTKENPQLLLYLLHGLYEAQDLSLCQFVGSQLGELDFYHYALSPVDCLSASYFISCICLTTSGEFKVDICNCSLDDYRVSLLKRELLKTTAMDAGVPGCIDIDLSRNCIHGNGTRCIAELISHSTVISKLSLRGNKIQEGENGLSHLSQALRTNTSLVELDLSSCGITAKSVEALANALSSNLQLTLLDISGSELGDKGLASLCNSLTVTCCIKTLLIENCNVSEEGIKVLVDSLLAPAKASLEDLVGAENAISDDGVGYIAKSLEVNKALKLLDIAECGITEKGAKFLAECLKVNQTLVFLALHSNHISDAGATVIANALPHNHALKQLGLSKCGLTDQCMGPLVRALKVNTSLERLDLAWNHFTDAGLVMLGEGLKKNRGLQIMELEYLKEATDEGLKQFVLSLQENCCLTKLDVLETAGGSKVVQDEAEIVNQRRRERGITELTVTGHC